MFSIHADVFANREAHVGLEWKMRGYATSRVGALSADRRPSNKPIEVRDRGRLGTGRRQEHVKERSARAKQFKPARDRLWNDTCGAVASLARHGSGTTECWNPRGPY